MWHNSKVLPGDARVPSLEEPDEIDQYSILEGLQFGSALKRILEMVHPNLQLTRNCQYMMNDIVGLLIRRVCNELKLKSLSFSKENMHTIIPFILDEEGELVRHAKSEMNREALQCEELYPLLMSYVIEIFPDISGNNMSESQEWQEGVKCCSQFVDYLCAEFLELAGNASLDRRTKAVGVEHVCVAIGVDEELERTFQHIAFGQLKLSAHLLSARHDCTALLTTMTEAQNEMKHRKKHDDFIHSQVN
jgi:hypothetical protein